MCLTSCTCRYVITENRAPTPQNALASVNQSARWNSRIIENGFGLSMAAGYGTPAPACGVGATNPGSTGPCVRRCPTSAFLGLDQQAHPARAPGLGLDDDAQRLAGRQFAPEVV